MKKGVSSGINLFAGFSAASASQDKSLYYSRDSPYSETEYYELKNMIEKLSKKSQNTKIKSLSRISEICEVATDFTLFIDLLPNWIFLFSRIVKYDSEKSVREAAFKLQALFFSKFKTKFVNFVQEIFTPIWLGRNDPCKEVAEAAKKAFLTAFPENKHAMVIEKCIDRYISEILPILNKELQESEEIMERLMNSAILGIRDALTITEAIKNRCEVFISTHKIWSFIEVSYKPLVRCAALQCFDTFLSLNMLNEEHMSQSCPIIFALISDKNRLVHQVLWGQVLLSLMEKFPNFTKYVNSNKVISELIACTSRGASGAGPTFYLALVKVLSLFDKEKFQDKKAVENLLMGILKGMNSEEGSFYGKYALNAYYEVLLFAYLKLGENNKYLDIFVIHPIGLYLACNTPVNNSSHLSVIPALVGQTLEFLETKSRFPDLSQHLFHLISKSLTEKVEITVIFLEEFSKKVGSQGPQCKTLVQNLLYIIHSQLSQDIDNRIVIKDFAQLAVKLPLFRTFSEITMIYSSFEPKIFEWWVKSCNENLPLDTLAGLANVIFIHPMYWKQAVEFSIENIEQLGLLIPEKFETQLVSVSKSLEFVHVPEKLLKKLENSQNLAEISKISNCLQKLYHKDMVLHTELSGTFYEIIAKLLEKIEKPSEPNTLEYKLSFSKLSELFLILNRKIDEKSAVFLSQFLTAEGWKSKTSEVWQICSQLNAEALMSFIESSQELLIKSLTTQESWTNLYIICKNIFNVSQDKKKFLSAILIPPIFSEFYTNSKSWILFSKLVLDSNLDVSDILQSNLWLFCIVLGFNVVPCLASEVLLVYSYQKYVNTTCLQIISSKSTEKNRVFVQNLIGTLLSTSKTFAAYRVVLIQTLKKCLFAGDTCEWCEEDLLILFNFCMSELSDSENYTYILCDIINIFKSVLSESSYNETWKKWQSLAYESYSAIAVRIYAACIPDSNLESIDSDLFCLGQIIEKGLRPTDLSLVLSIVRRGGFEKIPSLEQIELLLISILLEGKDLHEVLPYLQRLLSSPSHIFNRDQISELIINIPIHNLGLTPPEIVEISETFTRLFSIADENIDEESLYRILAETPHISLAKSVYSLLEYVYSQCETKRTKLQAIPEFALKLINFVPNVNSEVMENKTLAYVLGWMALIEKYRMDRFHREKKGEGISDFMVCFKDLLENTADLVTVFLTTLMGYLHDESELDIGFSVGWTDVLNEDSTAKLACLAMYRFLSTFPSLGRTWWLSTDRFLSNSVQKAVKKMISSVILSQEIKNIENRQIEWKEKGLNIVSSKAARDITAIFTKSEFSVQVSLNVPTDYPLSPPEPVVTKKVKISEDKVRRWVLSIVQLLQQENSSLLEVIMAWKEHVERELEGIEDCFICYYLVHPTDKSLPNLPCQVCNNKFHKLCIQKWFNSSHNATCPLCRNPFRS